MRCFQIIWDDEDDPDGNVQHMAQHGLTVEYVIEIPTDEAISRSSGRRCFLGYTPAGDYIAVIYDVVDADTIYPTTAYEVPKP